jgi:hypothetical protein
MGSVMATAQLPQPVLNTVFPSGAAPGTTHVVSVQGSDLDEPVALLFADPRITGRPRPGAPNAFDVVVPADLTAGFVDVRFAGRFGVSNPRVFWVHHAPSGALATTNTTAASALRLAPGASAWGRVAAAGSAWFSLDATKGSRVIVRVTAPEIDSRLSPMIVASGPDGREWARVRRSGILDFVPLTDGPVRIQVLDAQFRGGDDSFFRIEHVVGPHVDLALPCVVQAGQTNRVTLLGRRLPGGIPSSMQGGDGIGLEHVLVNVVVPAPAASSQPWPVDQLRRAASASWTPWAWTWSTTNGPSNPVLLAVTTLPVAAQPLPEAHPSTSRAPVVVPVTPPVDVGGWFTSPSSGVSFEAKKGDTWWIDVSADRLGHIVDPLVIVQREESTRDQPSRWTDVTELPELDANPAAAELNASSRDAAGRFEAPQDGRYRVLVRDAFNPGPASARRPFRLTIRKPSPDLRAWAWAQPPPKSNNDDRRALVTTSILRRGGTVPVRVGIARLEGLDGPVEVAASGLPKGVAASRALIPAGQSSGMILLATAEDAPATSFTLSLKATATHGDRRIERPVASGGVQWAVADFNQEPIASRLHQALWVGIAPEHEPVSVVATGAEVLEAKAGSKLTVPVRIQRRYEFTGAFNLKPAGHPALDKAKDVAVPEKATNAVVEIALAEAALPEGEHVLWLQGQVAGKYRNQPEAVVAAQAALKTAKDAVAAATVTDKPKAEQRAKDAEAAFKSAEERAKPRDATVGVWSAPFRVRILPAK